TTRSRETAKSLTLGAIVTAATETWSFSLSKLCASNAPSRLKNMNPWRASAVGANEKKDEFVSRRGAGFPCAARDPIVSMEAAKIPTVVPATLESVEENRK